MKDDRWTGRCDLYTYVGKTAFVFEAKHYRTNIGQKTDKSLQHITAQLSHATNDAKHHSHRDGKRMGICFAVPFLAAKHLPDLGKIIPKWCEAVCEIKHSAVAWYFPEGIESLRVKGSLISPGVVALLREV